jgi:hypothetical protein
MKITRRQLEQIIKEEAEAMEDEQLNEVGPHPDCPDRYKDRDAWRKCVDAKEAEDEKRYDRWSGDMTRMEGKQVSESKKIIIRTIN